MNPSKIGKKFEMNKWHSHHSAARYGWIDLFQFGTLCCEPGFVVQEHEQWCYEISYIVSGKGTFYHGDLQIPAEEGDLILTPIRTRHRIEADQGTPLHYFYFGFLINESETNAEIEHISRFFSSCGALKAKGSNDLLLAFWRSLSEIYSNETCNSLLLTGYLQSILVLTMRMFHDGDGMMAARPMETNSSGYTVYNVIRYIEKHLPENIRIEDIAAALNYNQSYLSRVFKMHIGITLQKYLCKKRIECAKVLLQHTNIRINNISERLGYANPSAFIRAFQRECGIAPLQYRSNFLSGQMFLENRSDTAYRGE